MIIKESLRNFYEIVNKVKLILGSLVTQISAPIKISFYKLLSLRNTAYKVFQRLSHSDERLKVFHSGFVCIWKVQTTFEYLNDSLSFFFGRGLRYLWLSGMCMQKLEGFWLWGFKAFSRVLTLCIIKNFTSNNLACVVSILCVVEGKVFIDSLGICPLDICWRVPFTRRVTVAFFLHSWKFADTDWMGAAYFWKVLTVWSKVGLSTSQMLYHI